MNRRTMLSFGLMIALIATVAMIRPVAAVSADDSKARIGVYDSRAIAVAFVRARGDDQRLKDLSAELRQAAGDEERTASIKAQGEKLQKLRHLQGFSTAPVDDILKSSVTRLPEIARDAGVSVVVPSVDYSDEQAELVDLTDKLVAEFQPDEQTLKIIAELRRQKPLAMLEVLSTQRGR